MRFFSNENREPNDEPSNVDVQTRAAEENPDQAHDEHPDRVQSDPVSVPQQRSGSPWSDTPGSPPSSASTDDDADAELADQERSDGTEEAQAYDGDHRDADASDDGPDSATDAATDEAHDHDDADRDAVGHTDVGDRDVDAHDHGPHADSVDLPLDDADASSDATRADEQDSATAGTTTTYRPDGTVTTTEDGDTPAGDSDDEDTALKDEGGFDDPTAVDPVTDQPLDKDAADSDVEASDSDAAPSDSDAALPGDAASSDDDAASDTSDTDTAPKPRPSEMSLAETTDSAPGDDTDERDEPATTTADDATAPVIPIPVPVGSAADETGTAAPAAAAATAPAASAAGGDRLPGSVSGPEVGKIFGAEDAQSFQDRWRDVQLRFVDGPKDATAEAAALLDEVVDKLASSLRAQKESLSRNTSDDTEQLRVELRGYRELMTRVLGL
jgi:hypothetical protein